MLFAREDWTLFRNLSTIAQKAGVPPQRLRRLVLKELVDNALDVCGECEFGKHKGGVYWVRDRGPGLDMTSKAIANLFSINRPLTSSKIIRKPSRGALGNGLRVVVGAITASGGNLTVSTNGWSHRIVCDTSTGLSACESTPCLAVTTGTLIEYSLGDSVPEDEYALTWAKKAVNMAAEQGWTEYKGKTSPWWYDSDSFHELLQAAGDRPVNEILALFGVKNADRTTGRTSAWFGGSVSRPEADKLLSTLREELQPVRPAKLGGVGWWPAKQVGTISIKPGHGIHSAELPFVIEALAAPINDNPTDDKEDTDDVISVFVNGTPITGSITIERRGANKVAVFGCGLKHLIRNVPKRKFLLWLGITTPYQPITTDGKEPNFLYYLDEIAKVTQSATRKLKSMIVRSGAGQRDIILKHLEEAIAAASGNGVYRYSLRQLFYAVRPHILEKAEKQELDYNYFGRVITDYEAVHGELPKIYRDPRGTMYQPHIHRSTPTGTIAVEQYERPAWTFNKILFCEKEGFFSLLHEINWAERNDCALLSSKGFASRAVRDVMDLLGETDEEIQFFSIHDADASGTLIHQSLAESTTARAARKVKVLNLGLEPWTATDMGLQVETFSPKKKLPVARYIKEYDSENDTQWQTWLQTQRVELNAMTSPQFIEWLDEAVAEHTTGKIIPPAQVLTETFSADLRTKVRDGMIAKLIKEHKVDQRTDTIVIDTVKALKKNQLHSRVVAGLKKTPEDQWKKPLAKLADELVPADFKTKETT